MFGWFVEKFFGGWIDQDDSVVGIGYDNCFLGVVDDGSEFVFFLVYQFVVFFQLCCYVVEVFGYMVNFVIVV